MVIKNNINNFFITTSLFKKYDELDVYALKPLSMTIINPTKQGARHAKRHAAV